jgi:hypothetical protein
MPAEQSAAIAALGNVNHPGTVCRGDRLRAIGAAIVGDHHLTRAAASGEEGPRFGDAARQGLRFIQARHQDGEFAGFAHAFVPQLRPLIGMAQAKFPKVFIVNGQVNCSTLEKSEYLKLTSWPAFLGIRVSRFPLPVTRLKVAVGSGALSFDAD